MIIDKFENIMSYEPMVNRLREGMAALNSLQRLETGVYPFDGGFFKIVKGETRQFEEGLFEGHRKFVDVHIMVKGCEELAWKEINELKTVEAYNAEKDMEHLNGDKSHRILVTEGMFYMAFPQDGHQAVSHTDEQHSYTKIIMKLPL